MYKVEILALIAYTVMSQKVLEVKGDLIRDYYKNPVSDKFLRRRK